MPLTECSLAMRRWREAKAMRVAEVIPVMPVMPMVVMVVMVVTTAPVMMPVAMMMTMMPMPMMAAIPPVVADLDEAGIRQPNEPDSRTEGSGFNWAGRRHP